jgi:DNA-3-methyladenine glycosylase II
MNISWQHDPVMQQLAETLPPPQPYPHQDTYLFLMGSIISQQLSTKVAKVIRERFLNLFPDKYPYAPELLELSLEKLRSVGLSQGKASYVQHIAQFHLAHPLHFAHLSALSDSEVIQLLTQIRGVGTWTAQMLLMFPMNRPDVFAIDDLVIRQQMIKLYQIEETGKLLTLRLHSIADNWKPHRTLACKYLWNAKDGN